VPPPPHLLRLGGQRLAHGGACDACGRLGWLGCGRGGCQREQQIRRGHGDHRPHGANIKRCADDQCLVQPASSRVPRCYNREAGSEHRRTPMNPRRIVETWGCRLRLKHASSLLGEPAVRLGRQLLTLDHQAGLCYKASWLVRFAPPPSDPTALRGQVVLARVPAPQGLSLDLLVRRTAATPPPPAWPTWAGARCSTQTCRRRCGGCRCPGQSHPCACRDLPAAVQRSDDHALPAAALTLQSVMLCCQLRGFPVHQTRRYAHGLVSTRGRGQRAWSRRHCRCVPRMKLRAALSRE